MPNWHCCVTSTIGAEQTSRCDAVTFHLKCEFHLTVVPRYPTSDGTRKMILASVLNCDAIASVWHRATYEEICRKNKTKK